MTDAQHVRKIKKMNLCELFAEVMQDPAVLTDSYYGKIGSAICERYERLTKQSTIAHVIKCNDSVEAVVLNDEAAAERVKEELRAEYYGKNRHAFSTFEAYRRQCYWHIDSVAVRE